MEHWINHPGCQNPVSLRRYLKFQIAEWLAGIARRWEYEALYPNCTMCGKPRDSGDHCGCDELPF
jgi:hypothetical protein